jgi:uncharacterized membrane protein
MSVLRGNLLGCLWTVVLCATANAAVTVPIALLPGSTTTNAFGINDDNVIAGSFIDQNGAEHGFVGPVNGTYTTFDAGPGGTQARGLNNDGYIVGFSNSQIGDSTNQPNFERLPNGKILTVSWGTGALFGQTYGIANDSNKFVGARWDQHASHLFPYQGQHGDWDRDIGLQAPYETAAAYGINTHGDIVGGYSFPPAHGYIARRDKFAIVDYPGETEGTTRLSGTNDRGHAVGQWFDADGNMHSFLLHIASSAFIDIKVRGAKNVAAWGINNEGAVAVTTDIGAFIWCKKASSCPAGGTRVDAAEHVPPASVRTMTGGR